QWSSGQTVQAFTWGSSGNFSVTETVTVTDANGCSATSDPVTLRWGSLTHVYIDRTTPLTWCVGTNGGSLTALPDGGGVSTYQWGYETSSSGPITPIPGATAKTYQLRSSDFPGPAMYLMVCTVTPHCGPVTVSEYQRVDLQSPLSPPYIQAPTDICPTGHSRIATSCEYSTFHWSIAHGTFKPNGTSGVFGSDPNSCSVDFE